MKQVIILESRGMIGGACESIRLLIQNIGHLVDLIVPKGEEDYISKRMIKQFYGKNVNRIFEFYLPLNLQNTNGSEIFDIDLIERNFRLFKKNRKELYDFLKKENYAHIHLNGLGLYPVLTRKFPMTIHIRQVFEGNILQKLMIERYLLRAKAVIYIDSSTKEAIKGLKTNNLTISNPIDQTMVNKFDREKVMEDYGFQKHELIFTIAGTIAEHKGHEFLIHAFHDFYEYPYKLLIAGTGDEETKRKYSELSKDNPNIIYLGQISRDEMFKIYSITDYIIRAETFFTIGRTVYEGLYSGSGLIIQGTDRDLLNIKEYNKFKSRIYSYTPRDITEFKSVLHMLKGKKVLERNAISSAKNYGRIFNKYIEKILKSGGKKEN